MKKIIGNPSKIFEDITDFLEKQKEDQELICYIGKKENKESRTLFQNNMFYGLFSEISKHLGYDIEEVKMYFLMGAFGTKKIKLSKTEMEIPRISHTSELSKEQAIFFIDLIIKFIEKNKIPCKYTSKDFQNLIETYNLK